MMETVSIYPSLLCFLSFLPPSFLLPRISFSVFLVLRVTLDPSKRQCAVKSGPAAPSVPPTLTVPSNPAAKTLSKFVLHSRRCRLLLLNHPLLFSSCFFPLNHSTGFLQITVKLGILEHFKKTGNVQNNLYII